MFPRDIVCLRNISINTLHKGDDVDDDDNNYNNNSYSCSQLCRSKNQVVKSTGSASCIRGTTASNFLPGYGLSCLKLTVLSIPSTCK